MSSRRAWVRLVSPVEKTFVGPVAEGGGESIVSRREALSRALSSVKFGDEGDKGVIGRGLSGEGVLGMERNGGGLGLLSLRKAPSMMMFVVGCVSTRVSMEKDVEEDIRRMGVGMMLCCVWVWASFVGTRERAGGRSGERRGRGGEFEESGPLGEAVCTRGERGRSSRPCEP
jgi:hypothetical protein